MLINDIRDFVEQTKKDIKEVSELAIIAIKLAQEDRSEVGSITAEISLTSEVFFKD